jgi:RNA polymerase sigma-70 factor (ECF subfamily)
MKPAFNMRQALLGAVPRLRAFAISLSGNVERADDLVQDTLVRALANIHRFEPGTNLNAWLFTILRHLFHSEYRKRKREVEDGDGSYAATLRTAPDQHAHLDFEDLRAALAKLARDQREAVLLVGAQGFSYEEAATICGCAVGTIKSRVNRARKRLAELMFLEDIDDLNSDGLVAAALQSDFGQAGLGAPI